WQPAAVPFAALPWGKAAKNVAFFKFCIDKQGSPLYNAIGLQVRQPNTLIKSGGGNGPMKPRQPAFRQGANSGGQRKMRKAMFSKARLPGVLFLRFATHFTPKTTKKERNLWHTAFSLPNPSLRGTPTRSATRSP